MKRVSMACAVGLAWGCVADEPTPMSGETVTVTGAPQPGETSESDSSSSESSSSDGPGPSSTGGADTATGSESADSGAAAMDFDEVCALPTTINCWDFEDESQLFYTWDGPGDAYLNAHPNGGPHGFGLDRQGSRGNVIVSRDNAEGAYVYPIRDDTHAATGASSLKFTMRSESGSATSGDFNPVFRRFGDPPESTFARFGPGGEFWVRFAMRQSPELLSNVLFETDGSTQAGVKRLLVHGYESSESLEETLNDGWQRGVPQMYSNSGTEDYGVQDAIGCPFNGLEGGPDYDSPQEYRALYADPPCRPFRADSWVVYQMHVVAASDPETLDGVVELYLDDEEDPIIRVTNSDMSGLNQAEAYSKDAVWDGVTNGYGKLTFTLYTTRKDAAQVHPEAHMWIDSVVIARERVPALGS